MADQHARQSREKYAAKVMTLKEVSGYLHVHPSTVYRLIKRREIPAFRIGSDWRFNIEAIDIWRMQQEANGDSLASDK
jgi:excisionase family DNA binding protein